MNRDDLTWDQRTKRWALALLVAERDLERQEAMGRAFVNPAAAIRANRRAFYARLVDDDDFYIRQHDLHYGEVTRPPKVETPATLDNDDAYRLDEWIADGAPTFPDGPHVAAAIHTAARAARDRRPQLADAIAAHPWPRPADHYLDHQPTPTVALAIAEDLLARLAASHTGRNPDLAMRQAWDRRIPSA